MASALLPARPRSRAAGSGRGLSSRPRPVAVPAGWGCLLALVVAACGADGARDGPVGDGATGGVVGDAARPGPEVGPLPETDARRPVEAGSPCVETVECETGQCLHGVCSPICTDDEACPAGFHCAERGGDGPRVCSRTCDPQTACPAGLFCAPDAPGRGACVAPGAGAAGAACAGPDDCASWACVQGTCLAACGPDAPCPDDGVCLSLHVGGVCGRRGAGAPEAPCRSGADCASGVCRGGGCSVVCDATLTPDPCPGDRRCIAYETLGLCERLCAGAADCGPAGLCLPDGGTTRCQTRGTAGAGDACEAPADCRSGHCSAGRCDPECRDGCPAATACVRDVTGATCRPAGGQPENAPCATGVECRSGFCAAGRCGHDCVAGPSCPAGMSCVTFASGRFCFPRCRADTDCEAPAFCADDLGPEPVCFWRGAAADGVVCRDDFECRSGLCRGERCLPPCPDGACPGGLECRAFGRGPFCTELPAALGAECTADVECDVDLRCTAGRCLPACAGGCPPEASCPPEGAQCHPACTRDADCRPGFVCQRHDGAHAYCAPPGDTPDGAPCARGPACQSGLCHGGRCRPDCNGCTPGGGLAIGTPCARDTACASGLCVAGVCAHPCPEAGCGVGRTCVFVDDARVCLGLCEKGDLDCDPGLACAPEPTGLLVCRGARPGGVPEGSACTSDDDCAVTSPVCRAGLCHRLCDRDAECGAGRRCGETQSGLRLCVTVGAAPPMSPCELDSVCDAGLCEGGRCFRACADDCGPSGRCEDAARNPSAPDRRCVPTCTPDAPACPEGTQCRTGADGLAGCY